jgi:hypothetical protein
MWRKHENEISGQKLSNAEFRTAMIQIVDLVTYKSRLGFGSVELISSKGSSDGTKGGKGDTDRGDRDGPFLGSMPIFCVVVVSIGQLGHHGAQTDNGGCQKPNPKGHSAAHKLFGIHGSLVVVGLDGSK